MAEPITGRRMLLVEDAPADPRESGMSAPAERAQPALDLTFMRKVLPKSTGDEASVVPALLLTLYVSGSRKDAGHVLSQGVQLYLRMLEPGVLRSAVVGDDVARLTERRLAADLARLEDAETHETPVRLVYSSTEFGAPGDYGLHVRLADGAEGANPAHAHLLRVAFPWRSAEGRRAEAFVEHVLTGLVAHLPVESGTLGFGLNYWHFDRFARDHVNAVLGRYTGFEHSLAEACETARGRAPSPSWLTFLGGAALAALGGEVGVREALPFVDMQTVGSTLVLRAARKPPLGDLDVGAPDLGLVPLIARVLAPHRATLPSFGGSAIELDADAWALRFDGAPAGPYANRP